MNLKRWRKRQREDPTWDLMDKSGRPKTIHNKITPEIGKEALKTADKCLEPTHYDSL